MCLLTEKSPQISRGFLAGVDVGIVLSAKQCVEIGQEALAKGFYYQAIDWIQTALNKITTENDTTADLAETKTELRIAQKVVSFQQPKDSMPKMQACQRSPALNAAISYEIFPSTITF